MHVRIRARRTARFVGPAAVALGAVAATPAAPSAKAAVLWGTNFENGGLGVYKGVRKEGSGLRGRAAITTQRARTGSRSLKITLPPATSGGTVGRYQLVADMPDGKPGDDRWYGFSFSLGNDWNLRQIADNRSYFLGGTGFRYTQTAANGPGANLDGAIVRGRPQWVMGSNLQSSVGTDHVGEHRLGRIVKNRWTDVVLHIRWTTASSGIRDTWVNGVKVGSYRGRTLGMNSQFEHRIGLYEGTGVNQTRTIYIDNHRVGTSYASVNPARAR